MPLSRLDCEHLFPNKYRARRLGTANQVLNIEVILCRLYISTNMCMTVRTEEKETTAHRLCDKSIQLLNSWNINKRLQYLVISQVIPFQGSFEQSFQEPS